ncbi:MAG TPA: acetyl-CoA carboxylase carboxyltransferase subunit alpha, partial [Devosia sp.]
SRLASRADEALLDIYRRLTPWQKTQVARHPQRPHFSDYVAGLITDWTPLAGDRKFAEDAALQAGFGRFNGQSVAILGQEKGSSTETRLKHNFGMARPEGYRKAVRIMDMADRFNIPVISFVDTAGAYPGIGAEERGQAEAIARSTEKCLELGVPNLAIIIGEGGSGGAIAIAAANRVLMLENAIYSAISPEAGASILWRDAAKAQDAANNMKITATDLVGFGVVDGVIPEPAGGAHRHPEQVMGATRDAIAKFLADFEGRSRLELREHRREKFLAIGTTLS